MGHFRVASCLCVKRSLLANPFVWKCFSTTGSSSCKSNSFSYERFSYESFPRRLILKQANLSNAEMAYLIEERNSARFLLHSLVRRHSSCSVSNPWVWLVCSPVTNAFTIGFSVFTILYWRLVFQFLYFSIKFELRSSVNQFHGKPSNKR